MLCARGILIFSATRVLIITTLCQVGVNQALVVEIEQLAEQRNRLLDEVTRALLGGSISGEARRVLASLADVAVGAQDEAETKTRKSDDRQQRVAQKDLKREKRKVGAGTDRADFDQKRHLYYDNTTNPFCRWRNRRLSVCC